MKRPIYSMEFPDQERLKLARKEIERVLIAHDIAGVIMLHTPGMGEFFYNINPSYSVCFLNEQNGTLQIKSKLEEDHGGDAEEQMRCQAATANMFASVSDMLTHASLMFGDINHVVTDILRADHTAAEFVPDPGENPKE